MYAIQAELDVSVNLVGQGDGCCTFSTITCNFGVFVSHMKKESRKSRVVWLVTHLAHRNLDEVKR